MTGLPVLSAEEQRLLGSLLEKQRTVPASYPLSLNSLRLACNQTTSRDPLTDYDEATLTATIQGLKERGLLRVVWAGKGSRTLKYHQLIEEVLGLDEAECALVTVLLLRGAQSPGELRARTERLHPFSGREQVEETLASMAVRLPALVRELPLQRGHQDRRWIHLLGPVGLPGAPATTGPDPREEVLARGASERTEAVLAAYDLVAPAYAEAVAEELIDKPFEVWLLEQVAERAAGPVMDLGCGPGHLAAFLADTGAEVHGMDGSAAMVEQASSAYPDLTFTQGRFHQLLRPPTAPAWGAILAWYTFVHLAPSELAGTLRGVAATLRPGGLLALSLHHGSDLLHTEEVAGVPVGLDLVLHERDQVLTALTQAGLEIDQWYLRGPVPSEYPTDRLHVLARRPD